MIWFINNAAAAGTGTLASPFDTLAAFQAVNDGVGTHPKNGDVDLHLHRLRQLRRAA